MNAQLLYEVRNRVNGANVHRAANDIATYQLCNEIVARLERAEMIASSPKRRKELREAKGRLAEIEGVLYAYTIH